MRIGTNGMGADAAMVKRTSKETERRFAGAGYSEAEHVGNSAWAVYGSRLQELEEMEIGNSKAGGSKGGSTEGEVSEETGVRSEAQKIYEAVINGKPNPYGTLREAPKVPYGYLAKDGVIEYNGVCFVCDEKKNSICLGDMSDEKQVLTIPLSAGGSLKVNRANLGELSRAIGMFSPEDVNRIMRAIAQDTKVQEMKNEIEDTEASVGNQLKSDSSTKETEE